VGEEGALVVVGSIVSDSEVQGEKDAMQDHTTFLLFLPYSLCSEFSSVASRNLGLSTLNTGFCPSKFLAPWLAIINNPKPFVPPLWFLECVVLAQWRFSVFLLLVGRCLGPG
jgi:hypothetical protein